MSFFNLVADGFEYCFRCGPYAASSRLRLDGDHSPLSVPPYPSYSSNISKTCPTLQSDNCTGEMGNLAYKFADDTNLIEA